MKTYVARIKFEGQLVAPRVRDVRNTEDTVGFLMTLNGVQDIALPFLARMSTYGVTPETVPSGMVFRPRNRAAR